MHPITRDAILCSIRQSSYSNDCGGGGGESKRYFFFVATGKSRAGAITSLGPEIGSLISSIPGVYCQGLYCIDNQGKVIFERKLQHSAIQATEALAIEYGISIVAYDGDNLYTTNCTDSVIRLFCTNRFRFIKTTTTNTGCICCILGTNINITRT